jgi:hypothetical protein
LSPSRGQSPPLCTPSTPPQGRGRLCPPLRTPVGGGQSPPLRLGKALADEWATKPGGVEWCRTNK